MIKVFNSLDRIPLNIVKIAESEAIDDTITPMIDLISVHSGLQCHSSWKETSYPSLCWIYFHDDELQSLIGA